MDIKDIREGDVVYKATRFSEKKYCKYGGDPIELPIGKKAIVTAFNPKTKKVGIRFPKGGIKIKTETTWVVDISELEKTPPFEVGAYVVRSSGTPRHIPIGAIGQVLGDAGGGIVRVNFEGIGTTRISKNCIELRKTDPLDLAIEKIVREIKNDM